MYRPSRFIVTSFICLLVATCAYTTVLWSVDRSTYSYLLKAKEDQLVVASERNQILAGRVASIESDLAAKQAALDKTSKDLTAKIKELDAAAKRIQDQQSQLSANAAELSKLRNRPPLFSFKVESSTLVHAEQKKADVQNLVTAAYDVITEVYSQPYLLHSVTIAFVDSFTTPNAAAEIVISNDKDGLSLTIRLKDFNKSDFNDVNAVIHEIIHSFHGLAVLEPVAYEEGITVAAADIVMAKLIAQGKIPAFSPLYVRLTASQYVGTSLSLPRSYSQFYSSPNTGNYYQLTGYGWLQLAKTDTQFLKKFNEAIYEQKRNGNDITETIVLQAIRNTFKGTVSGHSIDSWLNTKAFALL